MIFAWWLATFTFIFHGLLGLFNLVRVFDFIKNKSSQDISVEAKSIYIIIPLLREQHRSNTLMEILDNILSSTSNVKVVLVTTEREVFESRKQSGLGSTNAVFKNKIETSLFKDRYHLYHYPLFNKVVAEQLNYAISELKKIQGPSDSTYYAFYNADFKLSGANFQKLVKRLKNDRAFQQSSLFTANIKSVLSGKKILTASFGIYQSLWTLKHEIPRYLISSDYYSTCPKWISNNYLNYCVTHGLFLNTKLLKKIEGFPIFAGGGEDIAMGYKIRFEGLKIEPMPILENSETPITLKSLWLQLSNWYIAVLGYMSFKDDDYYSAKNRPIRHWILSSQGLLDAFYWLIKGPLIIAYLVLSYWLHGFWLGLAIIYLVIDLPLGGFFAIYSKLDKRSFYMPKIIELLFIFAVFPITTVLRSFPAFNGILWFINLKFRGKDFIRTKTE